MQQGRPLRITGTDTPGQAVRATLGPAAASSATATAAADGRWQLTLAAPPAGGPYTLAIVGSTTVTFTDVWSGEVWIASGQSNMEFPLRRASGADEAIADGCAGLRLFLEPQQTAAAPSTKLAGEWQAVQPRHRGRLLRGRLSFRPADPPRARRAGRADPVGVGRHARRGLDAARGAGRRAAVEGDGRRVRRGHAEPAAARGDRAQDRRVGGEELSPGHRQPRRGARLRGAAHEHARLVEDGDADGVGERGAGDRRRGLVSPRGRRCPPTGLAASSRCRWARSTTSTRPTGTASASAPPARRRRTTTRRRATTRCRRGWRRPAPT